ncbi:ATP-binding protein [Pectobacterium brasiliense]|uniref:AAA family ATPase n=1 Tax=Pectobacterium brasiliense TaxID=180957 RepID=UPI0019697DA7|nr:AAA family ATPase [Pectobacterium brasiliense]MBN3116617.1 ATP-binding protein [Pectobacterium brasiliense]
MAKIKSLKINGFKSIWDQRIDFGQLNVIIGTNGAGKSNLLEAIAMLSASVEGGVDYERLSRRGSRLSSHEIFRSSFKNKDRRNTLTLEADLEDVSYRMSLNAVNGFTYNAESLKHHGGITLAGRSNNGCTLLGKRIEGELKKTNSILSVFRTIYKDEGRISEKLNALDNFAIYSPSTPILRGVATDNSNKSPLGLYGGRLADALSELISDKKTHDLSNFFELLDWFSSIGTTSNIDSALVSEHISLGRKVVKYKDEYMKSNFNNLYAYDVSEGALFILFVLILISHDKSPNIFALDNVDNALNPALVRKLMEKITYLLASEKHCQKQIFLTTHNPTTLDAIDLFNDDHRLIVASRSNDGQSIFTRISPPEGMTKLEWEDNYFGMKLSEIWLSGAIGGMPTEF